MVKRRASRFLVLSFDVHCNDGTFYGGREHATTNSPSQPGYNNKKNNQPTILFWQLKTFIITA